jgi:hypothetical protein
LDEMFGRRIVWVRMSCGRFVGGRNVKAPRKVRKLVSETVGVRERVVSCETAGQ